MLPNAEHKWRAYRTQAIVKSSVVSICRPTSKPQDLARPSSWVGDFYRFTFALDRRLSTLRYKAPSLAILRPIQGWHGSRAILAHCLARLSLTPAPSRETGHFGPLNGPSRRA